jgi:biopolymer transport protein ExbD
MDIKPPKRGKGEMLPLMDMIFLLMTTFIFMIIQMRPDYGVAVELPDVGQIEEVKTEKSDKKIQIVTVSIDKDNKFFVNKKEVPTDNVIAEVQSLQKDGEELSIILKGDKHADYGQVITLFNQMRQAGLKDLMFDVDASKK